MIVIEADVKNKWKNLRAVFMKEAKKVRRPRSGDPGSPNRDETYIGKWCFFKELSFLKDKVKPRHTQSNFQDLNTGSDNNETQNSDTVEIPEIDQVETPEMDQIEEVVENQEPVSESVNASSLASGNLIPLNRFLTTTDDSESGSSRASEFRQRQRQGKKQELTLFQLKMIKVEKQKIQAFNETNKEQDDEDMLFLKSLAPYFKYLTPVQKLRLKSKIQNFIADEISLTTSSTSSTPISQSILPSPVNASHHSMSSVRNYYENDPLGLHEYDTELS